MFSAMFTQTGAMFGAAVIIMPSESLDHKIHPAIDVRTTKE